MNNENPTIKGHPCFSPHSAVRHSRVHLPVAKNCNIQCKYCNRKYDCVNESRPGVSSAILSPKQALAYLELYIEKHGIPEVVGIAGPGDAFADPAITLETLRLVKNAYPDVFLCVATNGLEAAPYIEELAGLGVTHCTVTVNTVDPDVAVKLYSWIRYNKHVYRDMEGVLCLLSKQRETILKCKQFGITLKINTIVVPGINDKDIEKTAQTCAELGASVMNCMPLLPVAGSDFETMEKPDHETMQIVRWNSAKHISIVSHCARCRADAAGIIGKDNPTENAEMLAKAQGQSLDCDPKRVHVAVATREGVLVNQHLGSATEFHIYSYGNGKISYEGPRAACESGGGDNRWKDLAGILWDCKMLLVYRAGSAPRKVLEKSGIKLFETEGAVTELVEAAFAGKPLPVHREFLPCGNGCGGNGGGCG